MKGMRTGTPLRALLQLLIVCTNGASYSRNIARKSCIFL